MIYCFYNKKKLYTNIAEYFTNNINIEAILKTKYGEENISSYEVIKHIINYHYFGNIKVDNIELYYLLGCFGDYINESIPILSKLGLNIDIRDDSNSSALLYAICRKDIKMVKMLINHGSDVNLKNDYGTTALTLASYYNYFEIVKMLLDAGADPTLKNFWGKIARSYMKDKQNKMYNILLLAEYEWKKINVKNCY